jgi:hypothetical protein
MDDTNAVELEDTAVLPQGSVKTLGVTLDKRLAVDEHLSRVATKATRACLSLRATKGIMPAHMRKLFRACVLPVINYAVSAWYGPGNPCVIRLTHALEKVQRPGARMILRALKAVSLPILQAEAHLKPTKERLQMKVVAHTVRLISLPISDPAKESLPHALNICWYTSPPSAVCIVAKERLQPKGFRPPIKNPVWIQLP